jgi:hypothetical protein
VVIPGTALRAAWVAREEHGEEQSPFHRITEFCYPSGVEMQEALTSERAQETTARAAASTSVGDPPIVSFSNNEMLPNILAAPCTQRLALLFPKKAQQEYSVRALEC